MPQAASAVAICNLALSRIGQDFITSLDDGTVTSQLCDKNYDPVRLAMLRAYPWGFAKKRASLPALLSTPVWGYDNAFQLPADFVWLAELDVCEGTRWAIEGDTIVADADAPLKILYIRDEEDPTKFDAGFIDAMADLLAAEVSFGITKDIKYRNVFLQTAMLKVREGRTRDSQESAQEALTSELLTDVRWHGVGRPYEGR